MTLSAGNALCPSRGVRSVPRRTCIACRVIDEQGNMIRLAVSFTQEGKAAVSVDRSRSLGGRGAWIHEDPLCVNRAIKRKASSRAFRQAVDDSALAKWLSTLNQCQETSMKAGLKTMETR